VRSIIFIFILIPSIALALTAESRLDKPADERRAHEIFKQIRCVVCDGESINDSKADIAKSLRVLVREKVESNLSNDEILNYVTERYGDVVLMKPPFKQSTFLLWAGPFILLSIGGVLLWRIFQKQPSK
jgi:cytochrome c-type biogenesis protein CcmH